VRNVTSPAINTSTAARSNDLHCRDGASKDELARGPLAPYREPSLRDRARACA